jgi:folate-binding protein YgfZ
VFSLHGPAASQRAAELSQLTAARYASIDFLGLGGAALVVPSAHGTAFRQAAATELLDDNAWLLLRLERGFPEYGVDYEGRERPHEAALDRRAVSWSKGCYLGQEVVCMQDMRGKVRRSLRVLFVEAPQDGQVTAGALLVDPAGKQVGEVTSCAYSTRAGGWLAMSRMELSALEGPIKLTTTTDQQYSAKPADVQ